MSLRNVTTSILFSLFFCLNALAETPFPPQKGNVNDYAGKLTSSEISSLNAEINAIENNSSVPIDIVFVIMKSIGTKDIGSWTARLGNRWAVGGSEKNGLILVIDMESRNIWTVTGKNLVASKKITNDDSKRFSSILGDPLKKSGDFQGSFEILLERVASKVEVDVQTPTRSNQKESSTDSLVEKLFTKVSAFIAFVIALVLAGLAFAKKHLSRRAQKSAFRDRLSAMEEREEYSINRVKATPRFSDEAQWVQDLFTERRSNSDNDYSIFKGAQINARNAVSSGDLAQAEEYISTAEGALKTAISSYTLMDGFGQELLEYRTEALDLYEDANEDVDLVQERSSEMMMQGFSLKSQRNRITDLNQRKVGIQSIFKDHKVGTASDKSNLLHEKSSLLSVSAKEILRELSALESIRKKVIAAKIQWKNERDLTQSTFADVDGKGYDTDSEQKTFDSTVAALTGWDTINIDTFDSFKNYNAFLEKLKGGISSAKSIRERTESYTEKRVSNESRLRSFKSSLDILQARIPRSATTLEIIRPSAPSSEYPNIFQNLTQALNSVDGLEVQLQEIQNLNSMDEQQFDTAAKRLGKIERLSDDVDTILDRADEMHSQLSDITSGYAAHYKRVARAIVSMKASLSLDVTSPTKNRAFAIEESFASYEISPSSSGETDWFALQKELNDLESSAKKVKAQALEDIEAVAEAAAQARLEKKRQEKRDALREKKRLEKLAEKRRRQATTASAALSVSASEADDDDDYNYSSSSPDSDNFDENDGGGSSF